MLTPDFNNIMNIHLTRYHKTKEVVDGYLKIDGGLRLCDTAENAKHCLPAGTYRVIVAKCKFRSRKMPIILLEGEESTPIRCANCVKSECVTINSTPHKGGDTGGFYSVLGLHLATEPTTATMEPSS